jgi:hypothetical protein
MVGLRSHSNLPLLAHGNDNSLVCSELRRKLRVIAEKIKKILTVINRNWRGWPEWRFGGLRTAKEHALTSARSIIARFRGKSSDTSGFF